MLVYVTLSVVVLLGLAGLAIDVGHMYVVRSEAQSYCDAAALAGLKTMVAYQNTDPILAISQARAAALNTNDNWDFGNKPFATGGTPASGVTVSVKFGDNPAGPFVDPASAAGMSFVEVTTSVPVPVTLLQVVVGQQTANVTARAVAGVQTISNFQMGLGPFAPMSGKKILDSHLCTPEELIGCAYDGSGADPFGLIPGHEYTLRWPANQQPWDKLSPSDQAALCEGDRCPCAVKIAVANGIDQRGYALYDSKKKIREAVLGNPPPLDSPITVDSSLPMSKGTATSVITSALYERVRMDSDFTSYPYSAYIAGHKGNGRREIPVPVASWEGAPDKNKTDFRVAGFAGFFLFPDGIYGNNVYGGGRPPNGSVCAQYFGQYTYGAPGGGTSGTGGVPYILRLYR